MPRSTGTAELDDDQCAAAAASRERWRAHAEARTACDALKGSLVWVTSKGEDYLVRAAYDPETGRRRQTSLGRRTPETEAEKRAYDADRAAARARLAAIEAALDRQSAVNRALGLGRFPARAARLIRALDRAGLFGPILRLTGPAVLHAYAAAADLALDAAFGPGDGLRFAQTGPLPERRLLDVLGRAEHGFRRDRDGTLVAADGYRVEAILAASGGDAAEIERAGWYHAAPAFETVAVDDRGVPVRLVAVDPRIAAAAALWAAGDLFRPPADRRRDFADGGFTADLVRRRLALPPLAPAILRALPRRLIDAAPDLFER